MEACHGYAGNMVCGILFTKQENYKKNNRYGVWGDRIVKKSSALIKELVRMKLKRQLLYKEVFWTSGIVNLSLFLVQLIFFSAIYGEIEMIGT